MVDEEVPSAATEVGEAGEADTLEAEAETAGAWKVTVACWVIVTPRALAW